MGYSSKSNNVLVNFIPKNKVLIGPLSSNVELLRKNLENVPQIQRIFTTVNKEANK